METILLFVLLYLLTIKESLGVGLWVINLRLYVSINLFDRIA